MPEWESYLQANHARFQAELLDFLRIPSISALPDHAGDVQTAAEWVARRMKASGIENVQVLPTGGHPVVYGDWLHAPGKPTILVYGHFDVQPVDPVNLWTTPPFEPTIRKGRVYARGASDNKGNMLLTLVAVEAMMKTEGKLPLNVKFMFEGQEEIGSPQLPDFVGAHKDLLACDLVINSDSGQWGENEPGLLVGLRGGCGVQIDVTGATTDLHSGLYGGAVANPLHALAEVLASLHTPNGRIAIEGFYDAVVTPSAEDRAQIAEVPFDEAAYKAELGIDELFGEEGFTPLERLWARPTLEIVGMWGGFQGEGVKTVLPREAHAKITCRLVPNQDPSRIVSLIERHVAAHTPPGVKVEVRPLAFRAYPYLMPADFPGNEAARDVLREVYGREPYAIRMGGSVPVTEIFLRHLKAYSVSFGFGLNDEGFHAPDEFFRLVSFERGQVAYCKLLERLGRK
ncbi:MAG: dipeptidase [Anaerolineae bacterium]|nr:dipeptidase [Anaerolineae bacterium]